MCHSWRRPIRIVSIVKTVTSSGPYEVFDNVTYQIVVTNTGDTPLTEVYIEDPAAEGLDSCNGGTVSPLPVTPATAITLPPGGVLTCLAEHGLSPADFANGASTYTNVATVFSNELDAEPSEASVPLSELMTITKVAEGHFLPADPNVFNVTVSCLNQSFDITVDDLPVGGIRDGSIQVPVPVGATCTVTENLGLAAALYTVAIDASDPRAVVVTNTRNAAPLTIVKEVVGGSATFDFVVDCDGDIYDDPTNTITASVGSPGQVISDAGPFPIGLNCTVTESAETGWTQTTPATGATVAVPVLIAPGSNTVNFVNTRDQGTIVITKTTIRPAGSTVSDTFDFEVDCGTGVIEVSVTTDPTSGSGSVTVPGQWDTGTTCTVNEIELPGDEWVRNAAIQPTNGTFAIVKGVNNVSVTNTFLSDDLTIVKQIEGTTAFGLVDGTFTIAVDCGTAFDGTVEITTVDGVGEATIEDLPQGADCTVSETPPSGWVLEGIAPSTVEITDMTPSVVVTNSRAVVSIDIEKEIDLSSANHTFTFDITCDGGTITETITLVQGVLAGSVTVDGIPAGADCTVSEQAHPLFDQTLPATGGDVVLDNVSADAVAAFENEHKTGNVVIDKTAIGGDATFRFSVRCIDPSFNVLFDTDDTGLIELTTVGGAGEVTVPVDLPVGSYCTISEVPQNFWGQVTPQNGMSIQFNGLDLPRIVAGDNVAAFTNGTLDIDVEKTIISQGPYGPGDDIVYEIVITNTGNAKLFEVELTELTPGVVLGVCVRHSSEPTRDGAIIDEFPWRLPLYPGETITCTATYEVTQDDVDGGDCTFTNEVLVIGYDGSDPLPVPLNDSVSDTDEITTDLSCVAALNLTKTVTSTGPYTTGSVVTYDLVVENTGTTTLTGVSITEAPGVTLGACVPAAPATLAAGATMTCEAGHTISFAEALTGSYANTATADSAQTPPDSASATVDLVPPAFESLTITKIVESHFLPTDPSSFSVTVTCDPGGANTYVIPVDAAPVNGIRDGFIDVPVPVGAECQVTEDLGAASGLYSVAISPGGATTAREVTITNTRNAANLTIQKQSVGDTGTFDFLVDCGDNTGTTYDAEVSITTSAGNNPASQAVASGPFPIGLHCTVEELAETGWTQTTPVSTDPVPVTIVAGGTTASFTNTRDLGTIVITKNTVRPAGSTATDTFDFEVDCGTGVIEVSITTDPTTGSGTVNVPGSFPTGTTCAVNELQSATDEWGLTSITPTDGTFEVTPGANNAVTVTNTFLSGDLNIVKEITGTTAFGDVDGTFTIDVDCGAAFDDTVEITTVDGLGDTTIPGLPRGTDCTVSEVSPTGWTLVGIANATVEITGQTPTVVVTNRRTTATITISKTIDLSTANHAFEFEIACVGEDVITRTITLLQDTLTGTATVEGVPTGTDCVVSEIANPLFNQVVPANGGDVTLDDIASNVSAVFENDYKTGTLTIEKTARGGNDAFRFDVTCIDPNSDVVVRAAYTVTTVDSYGTVLVTTTVGGSPVPLQLPVGSFCTIAEVAQNGWGQVDPENSAFVQIAGTVEGNNNLASFINGRLDIDIDKRVTNQPDDGFELGDTIRYRIDVTNSGFAKLFGVVIREDTPGVQLGECRLVGNPGDGALVDAFPWRLPLHPGQSIVCEATHVVTQADLDSANCTFVNQATATGRDGADPDPVPVPTDSVSATDDAPATLRCEPSLNLTKTVTSSGPYTIGSNITYSLVVQNTGNVTLHGVTITEAPGVVLGACSPAAPATLAPNQSMTCNANHVATLADTNAGTFVNTATADSNETDPDTARATVTLLRDPELTVNKTVAANPPAPIGGYQLNSTITYDIVATNTGNITLTGVEITDPGVGATLGACTPTQPSSLDPGQNMTCRATHVVTQTDLDAARYSNTAFADSDQTDPVSDAEVVILPWNPSLTIDKVARALPATPVVNTVVTFDILVRNNGNVTLTGVTANEVTTDATLVGCSVSLPTTLAPGQSFTCTATHTLTQADLNAGTYSNTAAADSDQFGQVRGTATVSTPNPAVDLAIVKAASAQFVVGQQATFTLAVRNNGPGAEPSPVVTDNLPTGLTFVSASGDGWVCTNVGSSVTCRSSSPVAANGVLPVITLTVLVGADAVPSVTNTGLVTGARPDAVPSNNSSSATAPVTQVLAQTATPPAATPSAATPTPSTFAHTGAATATLLLSGVGMVLTGLALLIARRRLRLTGS